MDKKSGRRIWYLSFAFNVLHIIKCIYPSCSVAAIKAINTNTLRSTQPFEANE